MADATLQYSEEAQSEFSQMYNKAMQHEKVRNVARLQNLVGLSDEVRGDVAQQMEACRDKGAAWLTKLGRLFDVLLAPLSPEASTPLQTTGIRALVAAQAA